MYKAACWLASACALAVGLALAAPAIAGTAPPGGGVSAALAPAASGRLYGIAAISDRDVWAAGLDGCCALVVHWNGVTWSRSEPAGGYFTGVAASSASDVWAVGGTNWFSPSGTLAEHWNGSSWHRAATPSPAGGGDFNAVTALSPSDAWAVGLAGPGPGIPSPTNPLIEHWNSTHHAWRVLASPNPPSGYLNMLWGISAVTRGDIWAAGTTDYGSTLITHWNGSSWG